ncbi:MAG: glycosyltransferase [Flavobacteriales bacterium]|nr:glycosyltransferase [Flavobacteriales bacterium]
MTGPKVSIIIPVYNAAETLEVALQSVFNQSYLNKEVIVVDGLSSDKSADIIRQYASQITTMILEKDRGVYDAMNKGVAVSTGEWVFLMGADDQFATKDVLEKILQHADGQAEILFGNVENISRKHALVPKIHRSKFNGDMCWRNTLHQQSVFYSRSLLVNRPFHIEYKILADYDLHLTLFEDRIQGKFVDIIVAKCLADGLSKNFNWSLYREEIRMKRTHIKKQGWLFSLLFIPSVLIKFFLKKITS